MGARRAGRAFVQVDEEVRVELHPAVRAAVHAQQPGAQLGIELVVPGRVQRVGDVEPAAVERQLEHLRAAVELARAVDGAPEHAAELELAGQLRVLGVRDVVLAQVAEVKELQLPLGWSTDRKDPRWFDSFWGFLGKVLGLLATTIALTLGAPFWFDLLGRVSRVRTTGKPEREGAA